MASVGFPRYRQQQEKRQWTKHPWRSIAEKTALLVGLGRIGARVAAKAKQNGSDYLVYLKILNWEERVTAWSGMPDRMEIEIRAIDIGKNDEAIGADHMGHAAREPVVVAVT